MSDNPIAHARRFFEILHTTESPETDLRIMEAKLKDAGLGYEALDPTRQKTAAQIKAEISELVTQGHLRGARKAFEKLHTAVSPDLYVEAMATRLAAAGAGYEALDPTGQKTT